MKATADGCSRLDVNALHRKGALRPGAWCELRWSRGGEETASIGTLAQQDGVQLVYEVVDRRTEEREVLRYLVRLTWTDCNYGGQRPWFICPNQYCGQRVRTLYLRGRHFLCRRCHNLAYESQRESPKDRALTRAQDIRRRLGGSANMLEPFPPKPPRMHWRTYERLWERHEEADRERSAYVFVWLARVARWLERRNGQQRTVADGRAAVRS